jgi:hypothetical protein
MWLRFVLYACLLPPIGVGLGLGRRPHAATAMAVGVAVCTAAFLWPRVRGAVAAYYQRSRTLRLADAGSGTSAWCCWSAGDARSSRRNSRNPLLASPNAGTQSRIEKQRQELLAFYGAGRQCAATTTPNGVRAG